MADGVEMLGKKLVGSRAKLAPLDRTGKLLVQLVNMLFEVSLEGGAEAAILAEEGFFLLVHGGNVAVKSSSFGGRKATQITRESEKKIYIRKEKDHLTIV
jgi:hypothetical protein